MRDWAKARRERTRHLIELGGLVQKAGLVELVDDDRATLLGAFLELADQLRGATTPASIPTTSPPAGAAAASAPSMPTRTTPQQQAGWKKGNRRKTHELDAPVRIRLHSPSPVRMMVCPPSPIRPAESVFTPSHPHQNPPGQAVLTPPERA